MIFPDNHEISKSTIKTPEKCEKYVQNQQGRQRRRSSVFMANFVQISHIALLCPLLTFNR